MVVKGYSTFPKAPALLEPHRQIVISRTLVVGGGQPTVEMQSMYSTASTNSTMSNPESIRTLEEKVKWKVLGNIGSGYHKKTAKKKKEKNEEQENWPKPNSAAEIFSEEL